MLTRKKILFCRFQFKGQLTIARPPTPDDSGLEDDMTVVPADTLFELLRRTFHLTQEKFQQFEHQIYRYHQKKDPSRVNTPIAVGGATFIMSLTDKVFVSFPCIQLIFGQSIWIDALSSTFKLGKVLENETMKSVLK